MPFCRSANDVANAFATSVGSKALTVKQACCIAVVMEFVGACFMGGEVVKTIRGSLANINDFKDNPPLLMWGCMCVDIATAVWLILATKFEMPVSTTHSCVGGMIGMTIALRGANSVIWFKEADAEGGVLDAAATFSGPTEKTLVLIKPDNFAFTSTRPGGVIDLFARTGLALVGFKPFHMSVAQGEEFYGPVLDFLVAKLPDGRAQWESIVAFMSGKRPSECSDGEKSAPGSQPCVALIYQGPDAVAKIRGALGPTNPSQAPHGTIRKEFGATIMINGAHASDSVENVARETGIIRLAENDFKTKIAAAL